MLGRYVKKLRFFKFQAFINPPDNAKISVEIFFRLSKLLFIKRGIQILNAQFRLFVFGGRLIYPRILEENRPAERLAALLRAAKRVS